MNNNFFSMMRYLRDLGVDAYLIPYTTDGKSTLSHFIPENDTWDFSKWSPYILNPILPNGRIRGLLSFFHRGRIKEVFDNYDLIIGTGFAPAYAYMAGRSLDIFIPYSFRGEFLHYPKTSNFFNAISRWIQSYCQLQGLNRTKIICGIDHKERIHFKKNGLKIHSLPIPMLYYEEPTSIPHHLVKTMKCMQKSNFVVFSHLTHGWKNQGFKSDIKRNDLLIQGFAECVRDYGIDATLFLIEVGFDVQASKDLIEKLGIGDHVQWLPRFSRKEILELLPYVNIGGNALSGLFWGGSGWEFLMKGVPMIHNLSNAYESDHGLDSLPPFYNVSSIREISEAIYEAYTNEEKNKAIGSEAKQWFNANQGYGLAKTYVKLIDSIVNKVVLPEVTYNYTFW
ncbi:hypothetical protein [Ekhidna sp.]|uniref:hypothetical protein n=1 Tax=Ekhidna sp. TaxID=2608089 RepID=UPI003C7E8059